MKKSELIASVVGIAKANGYTMTKEQIEQLSKLTVKRIHERFCLLVWGHFGALTATDEEIELFNFTKEYDAHTNTKLAVEMAKQF